MALGIASTENTVTVPAILTVNVRHMTTRCMEQSTSRVVVGIQPFPSTRSAL